jgi:PAS domain S-box-containing protein
VLVYNREGIIYRANASAARAHGFDPSKQDRLATNRALIIHSVDGKIPAVEELPSYRALRGETVVGEQYEITNSLGRSIDILASSTPLFVNGMQVGAVSVWHDITKQLGYARALRKSEELFRQLADSMPQLVWMAKPDGAVDYYNRRFQEFRGIAQTGENNWQWTPVIHPDDLEATVDAWQRAIATGEIYQAEHRVQMADGSYRWHLSRGLPVRDEQGAITRWFGTATDIHEQKLVEEKLEASNRALQEFAYVASHDLQEPLRKIEAFGDALLDTPGNLDDRQQNFIERMRSAAGRLSDMVNSLLQLSRVNTQAQSFTRVDLSKVVAEVISDLEHQIRNTNGTVELDSLPAIQGDPLQLHQLFQNLIGNALKYHRPGVAPVVKIGAVSFSDSIQITVSDNGIGFDPDDAGLMFLPFQRLVGRSEFEGSGMGLAICRRIAERHGGTITADGQPGNGANFTVSLPAG